MSADEKHPTQTPGAQATGRDWSGAAPAFPPIMADMQVIVRCTLGYCLRWPCAAGTAGCGAGGARGQAQAEQLSVCWVFVV